MQTEEKNLLLRDLSARLCYGVQINYYHSLGNGSYERRNGSLIGIDNRQPTYLIIKNGHSFATDSLETSKPYLRPMESMTEEKMRKLISSLYKEDLLEAADGAVYWNEMHYKLANIRFRIKYIWTH